MMRAGEAEVAEASLRAFQLALGVFSQQVVVQSVRRREEAMVTRLAGKLERLWDTSEEWRARALLAERQVTEFEGYIQTEAGQRLSEMEQELARTKLAAAELEAEKDDLEIELNRLGGGASAGGASVGGKLPFQGGGENEPPPTLRQNEHMFAIM